MKYLFLIAFASAALFMGANVVDACCGGCDGKSTVKTDEKKTDKVAADAKDGECCGGCDAAEVKADTKDCEGCDKTEVKADNRDGKEATAVVSKNDTVVKVEAVETNKKGFANTKRAAAGELVKADLVTTGTNAGGSCGGGG